jgi:pyridinium-3,5-biscarboxylic acid mononucleotide synthase
MFDPDQIRSLLEAVAQGKCAVDEAMGRLRRLPFEDAEFARVDHHRALRCGLAEVVYCPGKTEEQVAAIMKRLADHHERVLATRATPAQFAAARAAVPELQYNATARAIWLDRVPDREKRPGIVVAAAGTSDLPVAEEAVLTAELMGNAVARLTDVGVAGLHRLLPHVQMLQTAKVIVAVAGMEGALPSVIGGIAARPVIAVPTSTGYGVGAGGFAALMAMLNSCAAGVSVVNIDNGFGAGFLAALINQVPPKGET